MNLLASQIFIRAVKSSAGIAVLLEDDIMSIIKVCQDWDFPKESRS